MANEFKHKDPGGELTQAEFVAACGDGHIFACQATGDIVYASSATVLSKLARGAANTVLSMGGSCIPAWTASPSVTDLTIGGGCITLTGAATDIDLIDNNASALSFDASGKTGIIDIVTTNCSEGVTMSGTLGVTGVLTATGGIELSHACQNTLTGSGGCLSIQGNVVYRAGGTDVPVADGGTGASTLTDGGVLLGSGTSAVTAMAVLADGEMIVGDGTTDPVAESGATLRTSIGVGTGDSPQFTDLTLTGGCITITNAATDIDLIDNNACALSFDASGQAGILAIDTQNCAEGVKMSGKLTVTGLITGGSLDIDDVLISCTTIGHTCDADLMTIGNACLTIKGAVTVGVDDTGHDVKFFGAAAGAYMLYDQSCDQLEIRGASADATTSTGKLLLSTSLTNVNANDVIGSINFQAPAEAGGTDAIAIAAGIRAVAQATFTCAVNSTDLIFYTGHSEAATEKFRFTSQGEIGIGGANYGTDGQVLTSGGAGAAAAWENASGGGGCVVCDTSPQLGGSLDAQNNTILNIGAAGNDIDAQGFNAVDGSNSAPSYAFTSDPDMGFYYLASGRMGWTANSGVDRVVFDACGAEILIMCTCNSNINRGITINQTDADNQIFALKSSDIGHALTNEAEADTYLSIRKMHATEGGARIQGYTEQYDALRLSGCATLTNTTKASGGKGAINLLARGREGSTAGMAALASNGNMVTMQSECNTRFIFDIEGSGHSDVEWITYDDHCDIELLRGMHGELTTDYKTSFGQDMMYNLCKYEELGLVGKDSVHWEDRPDGRHQLRGMVNFTTLAMLHHSTIIQMADRFNDRLDGIETQLKALTEGK